MSNGFYNYIADNTISYFLTHSESIRVGERFSLILDNEELAKGVFDALNEKTSINNIQGEYRYKDKYKTFTIRMNDVLEIVVASKGKNVTDSFLAKLRNTRLTDKCFPILIITYDTIDTIISGTANLSSAGMPFNSKVLMEDLKKKIANSEISIVDQTILESELEIKQYDKFNDKTSLYEYRDILNVLGKGKIEECDYSCFSLFPDPEIIHMQDKTKIRERLKENRSTYDYIDRIYKRGNVKDKLEKDFDKELVNTIVARKKKSLPWHEGFTFVQVKTSKDKLKKKTENPLVINNSDINIYSGSPIEYSYILDEKAFIRDEGTSKVASRKKNILIYNEDDREKITVAVDTNIFIKKTDIETKNATVESSARKIIIDLLPDDGCFFARVIIKDTTNNIKYELKFCILKVPNTYLDAIKTTYKISYSQKKSKIVVYSSDDTISINPSQSNALEPKTIMEGITYECNYGDKLTLLVEKDYINPDTGRLDFALKCGGTNIPVRLQDELSKPVVLTGIAAFKKKYSEKKSLEYNNESGKEKIICGTQGFYPKTNGNKEYLNLEKQIIDNTWLFVKNTVNGLEGQTLNLPQSIIDSYANLIDSIKKENTVPSLVYYDGDLLEKAKIYVKAVGNYLLSIKNGDILSHENNELLKLGCVEDGIDGHLIKMSPLHPLNVLYQLNLLEEKNVGDVREALVERLTPLYLIPYIYNSEKQLYHAIEQKDAPEWSIYAPFFDKRYHGTRSFVKKLVNEKITGYKSYFPFLFSDINNTIIINLVNMGDCREVFSGLISFYEKELKDKKTIRLTKFRINIYSEKNVTNKFLLLSDYKKLKEFIRGEFVKESDEFDLNDIVQALIDNIECFYKNIQVKEYEYAHITFYEMAVSDERRHGQVENINTGISLGGLISGIPSVLDSDWYKTGFGMKYAPKNTITNMAQIYNAMYLVSNSGSSYDSNVCIFTEIEKNQEELRKKIYKSSNWVVFVDPKVDLSFFQKGIPSEDELMIIHYSDQYTSSNGYDDITVTQKSEQYNDIIREHLAKKGVIANHKDVNNIISLFNAINGSWMLRLITVKKLVGAADSNFSREKMSILSAIKLTMAYYSHPFVVWVPISLEEMLRVSGGAGYSQKEGILSAKNLKFEVQATSDDILLVGLEKKAGLIHVYIHPVEVKIGLNPQNILDKAKEQVNNTYKGLWNSLWPDENGDSLEAKLSRNFFMQLVIVCCEKMKLYNVYPNEEWDNVTDLWREELLNEKYVFSHDMDELIGKGTIVSFKTEALIESGYMDNDICILQYPETKGSSYMICSTEEIEKDVCLAKGNLPKRLMDLYEISDQAQKEDEPRSEQAVVIDEKTKNGLEVVNSPYASNVVKEVQKEPQEPQEQYVIAIDNTQKEEIESKCGMEILFGTDTTTGKQLLWMPNDTEQVFHTNTGIIGTMGTGKTQFTKSLIKQLYDNQGKNLDGKELGILIFDYKGDYNESKEDFVNATNAKILKPYQLPFNPLALTKSAVNKPLLPLHTANAFKDTISKVYGLGPKQEEALLECMLSAYSMCGIDPYNSATWNNEEPTFDQVYQVYSNDEDIKKGDSLAAAMNKLQRFKIFESTPSKTKSLFEELKGVVVIDLSGYDPDIQSLVIAITLDLFYAQMHAAGASKFEGQYRQLTKFILVDEADNFMSQGFESLKKILKEGREFGVGTILSTQFLKHFGTDEDDYSKYILSWVVHNVADLKPGDVDFVFKTEAKSQQSLRLFNDIKSLKKHHSIVKIGNNNPVYIKDKAFWELMQE